MRNNFWVFSKRSLLASKNLDAILKPKMITTASMMSIRNRYLALSRHQRINWCLAKAMKHKTTFTIGQQVWFMKLSKIHTGKVYKILIIKDETVPDGSEQVWVSYTLGNEKFEEFFVDSLFKSKAKLVKHLTAQ